MRNALAYALWLLVLVVPTEIYLRVTGVGATPRLRVHENGRITVPVEGSEVVHRAEGYASFRYNEQGWRGRPLASDDRSIRIAVLGDSYAEAMQVPDGESFSDRLEEALTRDGAPVRVLNFGVSGDTLASEVVRYRDVVRRWRPDIVLVASSDDDLIDMVKSTRAPYGWDGRDVLVDTKILEWVNAATAGRFRAREALRNRLRSYAVLQRALQLWQATEARWAPTGAPAGKYGATAAAEALFGDVLRRLAADVSADGGRLALVQIPKGFAVRDGLTHLVGPFERAAGVADVPFVSAMASLQKAHAGRRFTHSGQPGRPGGHLTSAGQAAVAAALTAAFTTGPFREMLEGRRR